MDSSNIEYSCIVYNREQSKENVRIIRRFEFHWYYPTMQGTLEKKLIISFIVVESGVKHHDPTPFIIQNI